MSLATLTVGEGWLKNFDALVDDAALGITEEDVAKAEQSGDNRVYLFYRPRYDTDDAKFRAAPLIVEIAEMFGAATLLGFKFARDGKADVQLAAVLEEKAERLMALSAKTGLLDADGAMIVPLARACVRVSNPE